MYLSKPFSIQKGRLILLFILCLIFVSPMSAATSSTTMLGTFSPGSVKVVYQDITLDTYRAYDTNYIAIADLQRIGCHVLLTPGKKIINIIGPSSQSKTTTGPCLKVTATPYTLYSGDVYLGNLKTQCLISGGRTFIPVGALSEFGTLSIADGICTFTLGTQPPVKATQNALINLTNASVSAAIVDLYWTDQLVSATHTFSLMPGETLTRTPPVKGDAFYIATLVQSVSGEGIYYINHSLRGQVNAPLIEKYLHPQQDILLEGYGDPITAGKVAKVEATVNGKNLSSPTPYLVWTNISEQYTYIFKGSNHHWTLQKAFVCSTGRDVTPTPKGIFALTYKVPSFGQPKGYCCKYAFGFIGSSYLYHSIVYDKTGTYLLENKGVLGRKASQGCIRFSTEHAKWFYDTLITKTTVYIS